MGHSRALVRLADAWFLRNAGPGAAKGGLNAVEARPVFNSGLNFTLSPKAKVAVVGDYPKTDFLGVLANKFTVNPIGSRSFPASLNDSSFKTKLLRFVNNGNWGHGAHDASGGLHIYLQDTSFSKI